MQLSEPPCWDSVASMEVEGGHACRHVDCIIQGHALALLLLLSMCAAPKAAREEYELYLQAVAGLLGGDLASEELQEAATQASSSAVDRSVARAWPVISVLCSHCTCMLTVA